MPITLNGTNGISGGIGSATAQNTTSGTSIDFTGIPAGVRRVTLMFNGVSTNGTANIRVQLGVSGGVETTGYNCTAGWIGASSAAAQSTTGFDSYGDSGAPCARHGTYVFTLIGSNTWTMTGSFMGVSGGNFIFCIAGSKALAATLDRVRITTTNGTDTFDAGSINILYE